MAAPIPRRARRTAATLAACAGERARVAGGGALPRLPACVGRRTAYSDGRCTRSTSILPSSPPQTRAAGTPTRSSPMISTALREAIERDEAAAAEPDAPEPDAPEPEPAPDPEPQPAPPTEKELAALGKKIDAENDRHAKRLQELYGPMWADLRPCPLCDSEGHLMPIPLEERDPAQVAAVRAALGEYEAPELLMLEGVERCPKCDGWGEVETPSRNDANKTKPCLVCDTRGYREVMPGAVNYPVPVAVPNTYANGAAAQPVWGEVDAWNRPAGHPHYGRDPVSVT